MSLEITKICRTCLGLEGALLSIYDSKGPSVGSGCVADMLGDLTSITPKRFDGMPEKVCLACVSEISRCYSFKMKCDNSDRTLRQLLNLAEEPVVETVEQPMEDTNLKVEPSTDKLADEKKKPLKRKAETTLRLLHQETDQGKSGESTEVYSLETEEAIEASYFVIGSDDEEEEGEEEDNETRPRTISDDYDEGLQKFVNQSQDNQDQEVDEANDSDDYKPVKRRTTARKKEEVKCPLCPMTFVHERNLKKHMRRHHHLQETPFDRAEQPPVSLEDTEVDRELQTEQHDGFELVLQSIEDGDDTIVIEDKQLLKELAEVQMHSHRCPRCGAGFAQEKSLNIHIKQNKCTEKQYACGKCQKVFISPENLRDHIQTHRDEFACSECNEAFSQKEDLNEHKAEKHSLKLRNQCPNCKKVFTMLSTLKDHMRIHSGERPFLCSVCGKGFSQNANLKQHVMRHNKTKPFKCDDCSRSFVSKGELYSHVRSHTGDHPFACDMCKTAFTTSSSLVKHKRIHTGERPYACEFCPMRFTALNTLKNHRRTHTGEKPFKCKFCQRGFAQKSDCAIHMRTHTGERRYVCQVCGSAFQQSGTLRTHMKTHKELKPNALQLKLEADEAEETPNVIDLGGDEEVNEEQQQEHMKGQKKKVSPMQVAVELGDDDLMHFAIEECSSENNDFSGE